MICMPTYIILDVFTMNLWNIAIKYTEIRNYRNILNG